MDALIQYLIILIQNLMLISDEKYRFGRIN